MKGVLIQGPTLPNQTLVICEDWSGQEIRRACLKCKTLIYTGPDLIGRIYDWCNCKTPTKPNHFY